ncbi:MAG: hypothetical protein U5J96_15680 [Ignavibacteriaceae bacterium]|nr:hypothetical protein [Ignavibacteriaceae bacterium]
MQCTLSDGTTVSSIKYSPATDQWSQLASSPYQVGACAFGIINNLIYCIGGNIAGKYRNRL